jgi:hypothetical protein
LVKWGAAELVGNVAGLYEEVLSARLSGAGEKFGVINQGVRVVVGIAGFLHGDGGGHGDESVGGGHVGGVRDAESGVELV